MEHLSGQINKITVNRWVKMFQEADEINLKYSPSRKRSKKQKKSKD